jgi:hypothetical protein
MKKSSLILIVLLVLFSISIVGSVFIFKNQYNQIDKTDPFWNYKKLAKGAFHHINLTGTNFTQISFIPSPRGSIGILSFTEDFIKDRVKASISADTLFVEVEHRNDNPGRRDWMKYHVLIAISCPELLSVNAVNSNLDIYKLKQRILSVQLSGKSKMEVESNIPDFDSLSVRQKDSTQLKFEMSEDIKSSGVMYTKALYAQVHGYSILDVGHFQMQSLHSDVDDTAAIILSGSSLKQIKFIP